MLGKKGNFGILGWWGGHGPFCPLNPPVRTADCTAVSDANFCPPSIFLHQMCTDGFMKHLSP